MSLPHNKSEEFSPDVALILDMNRQKYYQHLDEVGRNFDGKRKNVADRLAFILQEAELNLLTEVKEQYKKDIQNIDNSISEVIEKRKERNAELQEVEVFHQKRQRTEAVASSSSTTLATAAGVQEHGFDVTAEPLKEEEKFKKMLLSHNKSEEFSPDGNLRFNVSRKRYSRLLHEEKKRLVDEKCNADTRLLDINEDGKLTFLGELKGYYNKECQIIDRRIGEITSDRKAGHLYGEEHDKSEGEVPIEKNQGPYKKQKTKDVASSSSTTLATAAGVQEHGFDVTAEPLKDFLDEEHMAVLSDVMKFLKRKPRSTFTEIREAIKSNDDDDDKLSDVLKRCLQVALRIKDVEIFKQKELLFSATSL